ncbi:unnamed protein product [Ostreobium quekettii]|uniref:Uncharacterized protein n=1 Tax=Ostreobium quekettii TaxID=121088 RepID=A0A8S1IVA9_9CHLO|nr:unnamed protein product [Ostreobium quekettii]|eukprot:evm.model.scf_235.6 EVM.evm.TU.scf_235.6   scf_235:47732-48040(-)
MSPPFGTKLATRAPGLQYSISLPVDGCIAPGAGRTASRPENRESSHARAQHADSRAVRGAAWRMGYMSARPSRRRAEGSPLAARSGGRAVLGAGPAPAQGQD